MEGAPVGPGTLMFAIAVPRVNAAKLCFVHADAGPCRTRQVEAKNMSDKHYSLMIHGGAGARSELHDADRAAGYRSGLQRVLEQGRAMLASGGRAIDVVTHCAALLEDDPMFNAGRGSVLNEQGAVEMDAALMDGSNLGAGAVAGVHHIANPIRLARLVMDKTPHLMLIGDGAMRFADECSIPRLQDDEFLLPYRLAQLEHARQAGKAELDHTGRAIPDKYGTIGAVARDLDGNLAAATSTGGMTNKRVGRVGDTPIVGAGVYADNETCAVSATGVGEHFMRTVLAKTIADYMQMQGLDAASATRAGLAYLQRRVAGQGGVIVVGHDGHCASGFTTPAMLQGWIERSGEAVVQL